MKRARWIGIILFALAVSAGAESPFESFSGVFPADRKETTFFMYLKSPKKLNFKVGDSKGTPLPDVVVTEVNLTSATTVSVKNPDGINETELPEAGIYEIKVINKAKQATQVGFTLKIVDLGGSPPQPVPAAATPSASPPALPEDKIPVLDLPTQVGSSTPASYSLTASATLAPPSVASEAAAIPPQAPPPSPKPAAPASAPAVKIEEPAVPKMPEENFRCIEKFPEGSGYGDPFRPVEVKFDAEIPVTAPLGKILKVFLTNAEGKEESIEGQWIPLGKDGVRFLPSKLLPGAVYRVSIHHPGTLKKLDGFTFSMLPELAASLTEENDQLKLDIDLKPVSGMIPSPDSQVVRLEHGSVVISAEGKDLYTFKLTPNLAPNGNIDGVSYNGRPFHFALQIPRSKLPTTMENLSARIMVPLIGKTETVELAKATLVKSGSLTKPETPPTAVSATAPLTLDSPPPVIMAPASPAAPVMTASSPQETVVASEPEKVEPAAASAPEKVASEPVPMTKTQVKLKPVNPIADPGLKVSVSWERKIPVSESKDPNFVSWPKGVTWGKDGALWVVDSQNRRILSFNEDGELFFAFGKKGKRVGFLGLPIDIALNDTHIFISDTAAHCVHVFDFSGNSIRDIGSWGVKAGQLDLPHAISLSMDQLWVVDRGNGRVERFEFDGKSKGGFGKKGELSGFLNKPFGMRIFGDVIWTLDGDQGNRLQKFTPDGKLLGSITIKGFKETTAFELDPWGYPWIADGEGHRVYRLDNNGHVQLTIESPAGQKPWIPTSVSVRKDGLVAIGDGISRSIHLFRMKPQ